MPKVQQLTFGRYTSVLINNRGVGKSQIAWSLFSIADMAADVVDVLDDMQWTEDKSVHVVGHSMGGMIAQELVSHGRSPTYLRASDG